MGEVAVINQRQFRLDGQGAFKSQPSSKIGRQDSPDLRDTGRDGLNTIIILENQQQLGRHP